MERHFCPGRENLHAADAGDVLAAQPGPAAGRRKPRWVRSIVRSTRRSISTQASFRTSSGASDACDVGSKTCQFSQAYVIAHEIGHHVQNQLGLLPQVQEAQRGMDKVGGQQFAGPGGAAGRLPRRRLGESRAAAVAVHRARGCGSGDADGVCDRRRSICSGEAQGYVVPDAFTHGTSAQRTRWFMTGLKSGDVAKL